jgi:hypothetical protein
VTYLVGVYDAGTVLLENLHRFFDGRRYPIEAVDARTGESMRDKMVEQRP